jgi:PAS domain S-box-containing protein
MKPIPTNEEKKLNPANFIVSRTDLKGRLTYCNTIFMDICGYSEEELIGMPHSMIRHPDMPRCIFKLLWERLWAREEIFAYVKNLCKDGGFYWVIAHVTPTINFNNEVTGYHSNRRAPNDRAVQLIANIYDELRTIEQNCDDRKVGLQKSYNHLMNMLNQKGISYDEFILSL